MSCKLHERRRDARERVAGARDWTQGKTGNKRGQRKRTKMRWTKEEEGGLWSRELTMNDLKMGSRGVQLQETALL